MRDMDLEVAEVEEVRPLDVTCNKMLTWYAHCDFSLKDGGKGLNGTSFLRGTLSGSYMLSGSRPGGYED